MGFRKVDYRESHMEESNGAHEKYKEAETFNADRINQQLYVRK